MNEVKCVDCGKVEAAFAASPAHRCAACTAARHGAGSPHEVVRSSRRKYASVAARSLERENQQARLVGAGRWILALVILYILAGIVLGYVTSSHVDSVERKTRGMHPDRIIVDEITGVRLTVGQHRQSATIGALLTRIVFIGLAIIMVGAYYLSRVAPILATVGAFGLQLVVLLVFGLFTPALLTSTPVLIFEGVVFLMMLLGVRSVLSARARLKALDAARVTTAG